MLYKKKAYSGKYLPLKSMVIDKGGISLQFEDSEEDDLNEGNQLTVNQPDVDQPDVGCGGQLLHHTIIDIDE